MSGVDCPSPCPSCLISPCLSATMNDLQTKQVAADLSVLRVALARLRRQTRFWIWVEGISLLSFVIALSFWSSLLIDWFLEPPWQVRVVMWLIVCGFGLWIVMTKLYGRLVASLDDAQLALMVERSHPDFHDSLSTSVELFGSKYADVSDALLARTIHHATGHLASIRSATIFRLRHLMFLSAVAMIALVTVFGLVISRRDTAHLWMSRMVWLTSEPWPRRVQLKVSGFTKGVRVVARGSDVEVLVSATSRDRLPEVVDLRLREQGKTGQGWRIERMGTRGSPTHQGQVFGYVLKNVRASLDLEIRGGDARLSPLRLDVVDGPELESLSIDVVLPEYLGGRTQPAAASRVIPAPEGSTVKVICHSTKALTAASLAVIEDGGLEKVLAQFSLDARNQEALASDALDLQVEELPRSISAGLNNVEGEKTVAVHFIDVHGLTNREPITFVISAIPDDSPKFDLQLRGISTAVTPSATIPITGRISDDHGLTEASVVLGITPPEKRSSGEMLETNYPIQRLQSGVSMIEFPKSNPESVSLATLQVMVGSALSLRAEGVDNCELPGGPNRAVGDAWMLDVITPEAMQAMLEAREVILRRRYESVIADLSQSRDQFATEESTRDNLLVAVARLGESAGRSAGETAEICAAFFQIKEELENNGLLTAEVDKRLIEQIAKPLQTLADIPLPELQAQCRRTDEQVVNRDRILRKVDDVLMQMRALLAMMMELESFNEVIDKLRGVIRSQEEIRVDTIEQQKKQAREALEGL